MTTSTLSTKRVFWLLITLAGVQFTHIVDFMVVMPLGPQLIKLFNITDTQFGLVVSAYTFAAGASGLVASLYVDRFDRKKLLLSLYVLFGLATLACGLAPTYKSLLLARVAAGAFGGVLMAMSQTIVADVVPFERRGYATAIVMSSFSLASVAGVPASLFLAAHYGWHIPFFAIAFMCAAFALGAWLTVPNLNEHLQNQRLSPVADIVTVLKDRNHLKAFAFTALLMAAGFTIFPYLAIFLTTNAGFTEQQVPFVYLLGGALALVTARRIGRLSDSLGKAKMFSIMALLTIIPLFLLPLSAPFGLYAVLVVTTLMTVTMNGRNISGVAVVTSAANPKLRGTFMALNSSVQSGAMGMAAYIGGLIITRDPHGLMQHFWVNATLGIVASILSILLVQRLKMYGDVSSFAEPPVAPMTPDKII